MTSPMPFVNFLPILIFNWVLFLTLCRKKNVYIINNDMENKIIVDSIPTGIIINKNNEVDYNSQIIVELEKDINFEYAIVNEGEDTNALYIPSKKFTVIKHSNNNGIYKKKLLLLKSDEKSNASVSIEISKLILLETMGPRGTVLLNSTETNNAEPWYKNPLYLTGIFLIVILIAIFIFKSRRKNVVPGVNSGSIFVD
nr:MAG: hypothetical protein DiTV3a_F2ORF4 [Diabrotica toursvirus 3a]